MVRSVVVFVHRFGFLVCSVLVLASCDDKGGGDDGLAGQLGQPCIGGSFCNEGLICSAGVCMSEGNDEVQEADVTDGDSTGDETTTTTTTTGDDPIPLYEGPCAASDECAGPGGWCTESQFFCSMTCVDDVDCPAHPNATATPQCTGLFSEVDGNAMFGCALECDDDSECPPGIQCGAAGTSTWCAYL